nr:hypothetical protein BaRGS_024790 [Batillaria attramentaria]
MSCFAARFKRSIRAEEEEEGGGSSRLAASTGKCDIFEALGFCEGEQVCEETNGQAVCNSSFFITGVRYAVK